MKKIFITISFVFLTGVSTVFACPSCAATMEKGNNSAANQNKVEGYQYSIMGMMSMPLIIVGGFSLYISRKIRKSKKKV